MLPRLELLPIMLSSPQRKQRGILPLERIVGWIHPFLSVKSTSLVQPFFVVIKSGLLVQAPFLSILCFRKTIESFIVFLYTTAFSSTPFSSPGIAWLRAMKGWSPIAHFRCEQWGGQWPMVHQLDWWRPAGEIGVYQYLEESRRVRWVLDGFIWFYMVLWMHMGYK